MPQYSENYCRRNRKGFLWNEGNENGFSFQRAREHDVEALWLVHSGEAGLKVGLFLVERLDGEAGLVSLLSTAKIIRHPLIEVALGSGGFGERVFQPSGRSLGLEVFLPGLFDLRGRVGPTPVGAALLELRNGGVQPLVGRLDRGLVEILCRLQ